MKYGYIHEKYIEEEDIRKFITIYYEKSRFRIICRNSKAIIVISKLLCDEASDH